jgi:starch-binding outer membrane protein, SusD/RagB family
MEIKYWLLIIYLQKQDIQNKNFVKMNIKHLIISLLTFGLVSCSIEQEIFDTLTTNNSLKTQADVANFINGTYGKIQHFSAFKLGYQSFQLSADDMYTRTGSSYGLRYTNKTPDAFTTETANFWVQMYQAINNASYLISAVDKLSIDAAYKRRAIGEMYFMRALCNYYLVRMYGGIPLRTSAANLNEDLALPKSSVDEVYAQIFKDLEEANKMMIPRRSMPAAELGHASKGSAQAILASASLTYGNYLELNGKATESPKFYTNARSWADSVINSAQYSLIPNYNDLWDVEKEVAAYNEIIFAVMFTRDTQTASGQSLGSEHGQQALPINMPNVGGNGTNRTGLGALRVQPWFARKYSTGDYLNDYRAEFTILTNYPSVTAGRNVITFPRTKATLTSNEIVENQPYMGKFIDARAQDNRNAANDFPVIRLSEIFLIKAEAINELSGPTAEALTEFNKVRARARNANGVVRTTPANLAITGLTKDSFREKIMDERALEFLGEGIRWFDLVRWKAPNGKSMYEYQYSVFLPTLAKGLPVFNTATNTWGGGVIETATLPAYSSKQLLFPIPFNELQANPKVTQNPGY